MAESNFQSLGNSDHSELNKTDKIDIDRLMDMLTDPAKAPKDDQKEAERRNRKRIATILKENDIKFLRDEDDDLIIVFGEQGDRDFEVAITFTFFGHIVSAFGEPNLKFNEFETGNALDFCNEWNMRHRWPTLLFAERRRSYTTSIHFDAEHAKSKAILHDAVIHQMVGCTMQCFDILAGQWQS